MTFSLPDPHIEDCHVAYLDWVLLGGGCTAADVIADR